MQTQTATAPPVDVRPGSVTWLEPGLLFCYPPVVQEERAVHAYYDAMLAAVAESSGPFVLVSDTRHIRGLPDGKMRRLHARLGAEVTHSGPGRCLHSLTIVEGPTMRAILRVVLWILGDDASTHEFVATFDEATAIARRRLARAR